MYQLNNEFLYPAASLLCAIIGAVYDVRSRRVPNLLTLPSILFGLLLHLTLGGWKQLCSAAAAGIICGVVFLIFHLAGGMGGGDVKLIAAVGCIAGLPLIAHLLIFTALAGGMMAIGLALYRGRLKETILNMGTLAAHHSSAGLAPHPDFNVSNAQTLRLPYALAIAAGSAVTLWLK
jgi:prepilin peptidase CpaA